MKPYATKQDLVDEKTKSHRGSPTTQCSFLRIEISNSLSSDDRNGFREKGAGLIIDISRQRKKTRNKVPRNAVSGLLNFASFLPLKAGQKWPDARRPTDRGARRIETYVERRGTRATPQMAFFHKPVSLSLRP